MQSERRQLPATVLWVADKLGYGDRMHGLGTYYREIVPALPVERVIPAVLRSSDGLAREFSRNGVELRRLQRGKLDPRTFFDLADLIRREKVDLVHLHGFGSSFFGRLAAAATHRPCIVHQHDSSQHAPWYGKLSDRLLAPQTTRVLACSSSVGEYCVAERYLPADRIDVMLNGVAIPERPDPELLERFRQEQAIPAGSKIVGTLTRLREEKGVRYLIEAIPTLLERCPGTVVLIFGDGEEREMLERRSRELGISEQLRFLGFRADAQPYLWLMDAFVLPSVSEGGLAFAAMEALAAGRPVVATRVGGLAEGLTDGEDALLVPPRDPRALAEATARVLTDERLAEKLRRGAAATRERYSLEAHATRLAEIYRRVLA